jgi:hypothetical protein
MDFSHKPGAGSSTVQEPAPDPEQIDRQLSRLEEQLDKLPAGHPVAEELRQEIDTLRAMLESRDAEHGWSDEENQSIRRSLQSIAERLAGSGK